MTAQDLNSSSIIHSVIILLMFGVMWGFGIFSILICLLQRHFQQEKIQNFNQHKIKAVTRSRSSGIDVERVLMKYLDEIFPIVYQSQSYFTRMIKETLKHHRYIILLSSRSRDIDMKRILTLCHLLTVQTMLMFLLAVCYELQVDFFTFNIL